MRQDRLTPRELDPNEHKLERSSDEPRGRSASERRPAIERTWYLAQTMVTEPTGADEYQSTMDASHGVAYRHAVDRGMHVPQD
jgi:hypothetical protein